MIDLATYTGLFLAAFLAATLLPMQSEAALVALLLANHQPAAALIAVASAGNILGSAVNYILGRTIDRFAHKRWFPVSPAALARAQTHYARWGRWSLLLSWAPIIGDPITLVAGVMRENPWIFLALVTAAKTGRYLALAWAVT